MTNINMDKHENDEFFKICHKGVLKLLKEEKYDEAAVQYILDLNHVSFVELRKFLEPYMPVDGDRCMLYPHYPKVRIWWGMSKEMAEVVKKIMSHGKVELKPTPPLLYMVDGFVTTLPVVQKVYQYKTDRWLPMIFIKVPAHTSP